MRHPGRSKALKNATTGIKKLDEVTGGFQDGEMTQQAIDGKNRRDASFCKNDGLGRLSATRIFLRNA